VTEETSFIDAIVALMRDNWNLPTDCNDGELYTYAEHLADRLRTGDDSSALDAYLRAIQTDKLDMPDSPAYRVIAERAAGIRKRVARTESAEQCSATSDNAALPEMPIRDTGPNDGSPI
jgi:hypothetical protein